MKHIRAEHVREKYDLDAERGVLIFRAGKKKGLPCIAYNHCGYLMAAVKVDGKHYTVLVHRLIWMHVHGEWPNGEIDHINGVRDDNRLENLRVTDRRGNMQNQHGPKKNSRCSSVGVSYRPKTGQYVARIQTVGGRLYLGCFRNELDASNAYQAAKKIYHQVAA